MKAEISGIEISVATLVIPAQAGIQEEKCRSATNSELDRRRLLSDPRPMLSVHWRSLGSTTR